MSQDKAAGKKAKGKGARFVSFRDDGGFRFRLLAADGAEVLLSRPFVDPKEAGQYMRRLQEASPDELLQAGRVTVDGNEIAVAPADQDSSNGRRGCARPCCPCPRLNAGGKMKAGAL